MNAYSLVLCSVSLGNALSSGWFETLSPVLTMEILPRVVVVSSYALAGSADLRVWTTQFQRAWRLLVVMGLRFREWTAVKVAVWAGFQNDFALSASSQRNA